jgi:hypothetical protein
MKNFKFLFYINCFLAFHFFTSCDKTGQYKPHPESVLLNNQATEIMDDNPDSALVLLNKASQIDSNYYLPYYHKVMILFEKQDFKKALQTQKSAMRTNPELAEGIFLLGVFMRSTKCHLKQKRNIKKL